MNVPGERPMSAVEMIVKSRRRLSPHPTGTIRLLAVAQRPTPIVRSSRLVAAQDEEALCLACGQVLPAVLSVTGSIRCQNCREDMAPLRSDLVGAELVRPVAQQSQAA